VTLDKDFGELAVVYGHPHAGIIRLVDFSIILGCIILGLTFHVVTGTIFPLLNLEGSI
jgi:predicted nuclease of predicted toxin-antitoxin system